MTRFSTKRKPHAIGQKDVDVTHIAVVQRGGLTGSDPDNPTISLGFSDEASAVRWVSHHVSEAHGDEDLMVQRVYEKLGPRSDDDDPDTEDMRCVIFIRAPGGPTWGLVASC